MGLPGAGGADDDNEPIGSGDRPGRRGLRVAGKGDWGGGAGGPLLELLFLGKNGGERESSVGDVLGDRAAVSAASSGVVPVGAYRDALLLGSGREAVDLGDHPAGIGAGVRSDEGGQVTGDVGSQPRRGLVGHPSERLTDQALVGDGGVGSRGLADPVGGESAGVEPGGVGLGRPVAVQLSWVEPVDLGGA